MLATQSTAQISIDDTINAYENEIDQEYQTYWMFRDEQPDPSVFDPTFQVTLPAGQLAAWTTYYTSQGTVAGALRHALSTFVNNALTTLANARHSGISHVTMRSSASWATATIPATCTSPIRRRCPAA